MSFFPFLMELLEYLSVMFSFFLQWGKKEKEKRKTCCWTNGGTIGNSEWKSSNMMIIIDIIIMTFNLQTWAMGKVLLFFYLFLLTDWTENWISTINLSRIVTDHSLLYKEHKSRLNTKTQSESTNEAETALFRSKICFVFDQVYSLTYAVY